jgi:aminobenzoyl-glutamate utilization protein B
VQPNIIPEMGQIWWFVRDATGPWAKENFDKLVNIGKGAALMTGTTMEMEPSGAAWPSLGNKAIAEAVQKNIDMVGMPKWTEEENNFAKELQKSMGQKDIGLSEKPAPLVTGRQGSSSNDIGDITWVVPTGTIRFPAVVPGIQAHHWSAGITPTMSIGHKGAVVGAKACRVGVGFADVP